MLISLVLCASPLNATLDDRTPILLGTELNCTLFLIGNSADKSGTVTGGPLNLAWLCGPNFKFQKKTKLQRTKRKPLFLLWSLKTKWHFSCSLLFSMRLSSLQ